MSTLSQYHPFRDSVNKVTEGSPTPAGESPASNDVKENESKPWLSFKSKMRLVLGCIAFVAIWYVVSSFFTESPELKDGFYSTLGRSGGKKSSSHEIETHNNVFDERDLDDRGRTVSEAKSKAGFLSSLFCRGGKKASFCD